MRRIPTLTELRQIGASGDHSSIATNLTRHLKNESTRKLLQQRYLLGTLKQYSRSHEESFVEIAKLRRASVNKEIGAYVIRVRNGEDVMAVGLATVQPDVQLRRYRELGVGYKRAIPLPPRLVQHTPLVSQYPAKGSFVEAWTIPGFASELQIAYKELADPNGVAKEFHESPTSWAVEPKDSPRWVHNAIELAGYVAIQSGHFEHDASRYESPPLSVFYQRVQTPVTT